MAASLQKMAPKQVSLTMHLLRNGVTVDGCVADDNALHEHEITMDGLVGQLTEPWVMRR